ncbi:hypothetical protein A7K94_0208405 [Modestobacter sp. VKM Ac-2676]|nr:hypothetical protein A7K94_0208405 [Modestobacter sp. VKM Ac-2676]
MTAAERSADLIVRGVTTLLVLVLVTQRLLIPVGSSPVQVSLVLTYGIAGLLLVTGLFRFDQLRSELLGIAAVLCLAATTIAAATGGLVSVTSLGLLLVLYLLWTLRVGPGHTDTLQRVARNFVLMMVVFALIGVAQLGSQLAGIWSYTDFLGELLPPDLYSQSYNTNIPLFYGSPVHKGNAFVFLEPSFLSQFCALGAIVAVVTRAPSWQVVALVAGVFSAVSGTGIILLLAAGVLVLVRAWWLIRPVHLVTLAALGFGVLVSPVAPLLLERVGETGQTGSSGYLRFVQPYTEVANAMIAEPMRFLVGAGAGSVERLLPSVRDGELGQAVVYTIVPKLLFEYGLLAGGAFVLFIVLALLDRGAWRVVPGSVLVMIFLLSGSLLQPHTAIVAWLLTALWAGQETRVDLLPARPRSAGRGRWRPRPASRPVPVPLT